MRITYKQARADHEYLWETYAAADDMTGAYVDSGDLRLLLKAPTKRTAADCYRRQIEFWFQIGPDPFRCPEGWREDDRVWEIAERHNVEDDFKRLCAD